MPHHAAELCLLHLRRSKFGGKMSRSQELINGSGTGRRNKKILRCERTNPATGQTCGTLFTRAWNLQRHVRDQHQNQELEFVHYDPNTTQFGTATPPVIPTPINAIRPASTIHPPRIPAMNPPPSTAPLRKQTNSVPRRTVSSLPASIRPLPYSRPTPSMPPPDVASLEPTPTTSPMSVNSVPASSMASANMRSPLEDPSTSASVPMSTPSNIAHADNFAQLTEESSPERLGDLGLQNDTAKYKATSQTHWTKFLEQDSENDLEQDSEHNDAASNVPEQDHEGGTSGLYSPTDDGAKPRSRKRKRSPTRGRVVDACVKLAVPTYLVKMSKKTLGQQRALSWLHDSGKARFDVVHETLLAQWGVKAGHWGTCVLLPEDWRAMNPVDLMAIFREYKPPPTGKGRAWYCFSDHATTMARAAAWFSDKRWPQGPEGQTVNRFPRRGIDLDNFLGCGSWGPMDGSHLCHHKHCIIHIVYESSATNVDRWNCCHEARFLRQERREVPEHCAKHWPPCLMQVS